MAAPTFENEPSPSFRIRLGERALAVPARISTKEHIGVWYAAGLPLTAFITHDGMTNHNGAPQVLWWLARRHNGEENLSYGQACDEWAAPLVGGVLDIEVTAVPSVSPGC